MSGLSRLVVAEADSRIAAALRFGFEREGVGVTVASSRAGVEQVLSQDAPQIVIVGETIDDGPGVDLVSALRGNGNGSAKLPVLFLGGDTARAAALRAGALHALPRPAYVRDVVTLAKLLAGRKDAPGPVTFAGELADTYGMFYVVRALGAAQWSGVLTLVRGLRRGELRFYRGEVTSAQIGVLHGLAALHQLLLWTDGRVDLRVEDVVRRRQIPLSPAETLEDAERFLAEIREVAGAVSPSQVYEQVFGQTMDGIPPAVIPVVRLFDGARTVADVLEDSPFRSFDTLRIIHGLLECRSIALSGRGKRKSTARAALALEEWLVGGAVPGVPTLAATETSEPVGPRVGEPASPPPEERRKKRKKRKKRRSREPVPAAAPVREVAAAPATQPDWSKILPSGMTGEHYAAVVPAVNSAGEIGGKPDPAAEVAHREKLEEVTDPGTRQRIFAPVDEPVRVRADSEPVAVAETETETVAETVPVAVAVADSGPDSVADALAAIRKPEPESEPVPVPAAPAHPERRASEASPESKDAASGSEHAERAASLADALARAASTARRAASEPAQREASGEIGGTIEAPDAPPAPEPVVPQTTIEIALEVTPAPAPAPAPALAADAARVAQAAKAAAAAAANHFTDIEEDFFKTGDTLHSAAPAPVESFDDLDDEGDRGFWDRVLTIPGTEDFRKANPKKKR